MNIKYTWWGRTKMAVTRRVNQLLSVKKDANNKQHASFITRAVSRQDFHN